MVLPKSYKLSPVVFLFLVGMSVKRGNSLNVHRSDSNEECDVFGICEDPEMVLKGIINLPENYNSLFKAFHHTNHRNPPYIILFYVLNTTHFPASECGNMYGNGEIPGNHDTSLLQNWIWTTSPIHTIVNPFAIVEFGLFTPWISYSLIKPHQVHSHFALHTSACIAVPYYFSSSCDGAGGRSREDCGAYILASVTTVLRGAIDQQDWTYAQLGVDAQYALLIDSGTKYGGMVSMYVSVDERFKVHILQGMFYLIQLSLAVGTSMAVAKWVTKYAAVLAHNSAIPDVFALIWATVHVCFGINLFLSLKLLLVGIVYVQSSAPWIGILALSTLPTYTFVAFLITIRAISLYDKLCVPKSWQLVILILSVGLLRSKRAVQAVSIFTIAYFAPLIVLHLVISVCSLLQDPLQHGTGLLGLFFLVGVLLCLKAAFYSIEYIITDLNTGNASNYKERLTSRAIPSIKHSVKFCYFTMVFVFATTFICALSAFGLLAKLKDFYVHYQVSNGVTFIVVPPIFSFLTWAIRYGIINFKTFMLPRDIPFD